jgi:Putative Actinobacterial Holin-X, holin superfamily III
MKDDQNLIDDLFKKATEFSETYIELQKLKMVKKITMSVSEMVPGLIAVSFLIIFLLFISLALALWLGDYLGRICLGFLIVSAFYLVAGLILYFFFKGPIRKITAGYLLKQIFR